MTSLCADSLMKIRERAMKEQGKFPVYFKNLKIHINHGYENNFAT